MLIEKNGSAPFLHPTISYLNTHEDFRKSMLSIHQMHSRVSPTDPHSFREEPSSNQRFNRRFPVFVNIIDEENIPNNTPKNRAAWATTFEHFYNHESTQRAYTYPEEAHYAGDLTPQNEAEAPHLSHFLTIQDTMEVMREAHAGDVEPGQLPPIGDMLDDEDAMTTYYGPTAMVVALQHFASYRNHIPGGRQGPHPAPNEPHDDEDYSNLQRFAF